MLELQRLLGSWGPEARVELLLQRLLRLLIRQADCLTLRDLQGLLLDLRLQALAQVRELELLLLKLVLKEISKYSGPDLLVLQVQEQA